MTFREFSGKNVEEAIRTAMKEFASDLSDLDIEILSQGSRGILGVGGEEARILAAPKSAVASAPSVRSAAPPAAGACDPGARRGRRHGGGCPVTGATWPRPRPQPASPIPPRSSPSPSWPRRPTRRTRRRTSPSRSPQAATRRTIRRPSSPPTRSVATATTTGGVAAAAAAAGIGRERPAAAPRERDRDRDRDRPAREPAPFVPAKPLAELSEEERTVLEDAKTVLSELLRLMGINGSVEIAMGHEASKLNVTGDGLGVLIGRRGEKLASLQHIVNLMVARGEAQHHRIMVDVENYRGRREDQLRDVAERAAKRVLQTGKIIQLEAMPAVERRIVHMTLVENPQDPDPERRGGAEPPDRDPARQPARALTRGATLGRGPARRRARRGGAALRG